MLIDGTQIADKAVDGILQRIDALAAKIGTTAQHIWDVYVAQARVEAIRDTLFVVLFLIVSSLLAYLSYRLFRYGIKKNEYDDWPYFIADIVEMTEQHSQYQLNQISNR